MKEKCGCGGEYDYTLSDIILVKDTNPPEAELEGICGECMGHISIKFRAYEHVETKFDEMMNEEGDKQVTSYK